MAKKKIRGRKAKAQNTPTKNVSPKESKVVYERQNIFEKIYNLSIGRVRLVAVVLVLIGLTLIVLGSISLFKTFKEKLNKEDDKTVGSIDGGIQTENNDKNEDDKNENVSGVSDPQTVSENAKLARIASHNKSVKTGRWVATDYKAGDLKVGKYEVQRGDTLWEISEAVYGSGFQWHKILDANSSTIGRLPNGSQALIVPGQVITLP